MPVPSLCWEDAMEEDLAMHSSILTWRIPWTEEPGRLQSIGSQRVGHNLSDLACTLGNRDLLKLKQQYHEKGGSKLQEVVKV